MVEKKRTLWPIGILFIIVLGIILIVISIRISSKQSIDSDNTFSMKRLELNENINTIMQQQNMFENYYNVHISTIGDKTSNAPLMQNPYYISPVPHNIPNGEGSLQINNNAITLYLEKKKDGITETDAFKDSIVFPYMLTFVRLDQGEKKTDTIYAPLYSSGNGIYTTRSFTLPKQGFYQARLTILVAQHIEPNAKMQHNSDHANDQINANNSETNIIARVKSIIMRHYETYFDSFSFHKVYFYHWIFNNAQNHIQAYQ